MSVSGEHRPPRLNSEEELIRRSLDPNITEHELLGLIHDLPDMFGFTRGVASFLWQNIEKYYEPRAGRVWKMLLWALNRCAHLMLSNYINIRITHGFDVFIPVLANEPRWIEGLSDELKSTLARAMAAYVSVTGIDGWRKLPADRTDDDRDACEAVARAFIALGSWECLPQLRLVEAIPLLEEKFDFTGYRGSVRRLWGLDNRIANAYLFLVGMNKLTET
jgi:hypothetical protein